MQIVEHGRTDGRIDRSQPSILKVHLRLRAKEMVTNQQQQTADEEEQTPNPAVEAIQYHANRQRPSNWNSRAGFRSRYERPWRSSENDYRPNAQGHNFGPRPRGPNPRQSSRPCGRCGYNEHFPSGICPAKDIKCNRCHRYGHFSRCCQSNDEIAAADFTDNDTNRDFRYMNLDDNFDVKVVENEQSSSDENTFLGSVTAENQNVMEVDIIEDPEIYTVEKVDDNDSSPWYINLNVCATTVPFKIDCGADVSTMSASVYKNLINRPRLKPTDKKLRSASGELVCLGRFIAHVKHNGTTYAFNTYVVDSGGSHTSLLSRAVSHKLNLIRRVDAIVDSSIFGPIGNIKCEPVKIELAHGAVPHCINTAYRIPIPLKPKAVNELERMRKLNVIRLVTEPTEWCASCVIIEKPNGAVRFCVDMRKLNKYILRQKYTLPTADDVLSNLAGSVKYSKLDASAGFWGMPLDKDSQLLTTFIGPDGNRYCFQVLPFGISSASEIFQYQMTKILKGIPNVEVFQDDILVHGKTNAEHDIALKAVIQRLKSAGVKLNKSKCIFGVQQLVFVGHLVSANGIAADPSKVEAIAELPEPKNLADLRRINGIIQYLSKFIHGLADHMKPMNELLKNDTPWYWGQPQALAFKNVKNLIVTSKVLAHYDVDKPTVVSADASSYGLGGVLLQQHSKGLLPIAFCSRTLTEAEKNYAQIEKECLSIVWTCEKFARFLKGLKTFTIHTDHKPLVPLINHKDLHKVPLRCQRLLMRLMAFNPVAVHIPGKDLVIADALSRSPRPTTREAYTVDDVEAYVSSVTKNLPLSQQKYIIYQRETAQDEVLVKVKKYIEEGWPRYKDQVTKDLYPFFDIQDELSTCSGLVMRGTRIVVPNSLQPDVIARLHDGHFGVNKSLARADECVWWPSLRHDVTDKCMKCDFCQVHQSAQRKEPLITTTLPNRPWSKISMDFADSDQKYLVISDYYSRWIEIIKTPTPSCGAIIPKLNDLFATFGYPDEIISDNSPFKSEEFSNYCKSKDIYHDTSSPHNPQANGQAESAVKVAKRILAQNDHVTALQVYRATPIKSTGYSPAELMLGRKIRTTLPCIASNFEPTTPDHELVKENDSKIKAQAKRNFDKHHGARELPELKPNTSVRMKTDKEKLWSEPMTVVSKYENHPRSYIVKSNKGTVYRRNRRHLRKIREPQQTDESDSSDNEPDNQQEHLEPPRPHQQQGHNIRPMPELGRPQRNAKPIKRLIECCTICKDLGRYG